MFNIRKSWQILSVLGACSAFAETPKINPHPNAAGVVAMRSWDAVPGSGISWQSNGNYLDFSAYSSGSEATWDVKALENISYDVNVILNSVPASSAGLTLEFTIGSETVQYTLVESSTQTNVLMGTVTPGAGDFIASIKGADAYSSAFTGVLRVVLTPTQRHRWWNPLTHKWQTGLPSHLGSQWNNNGWFPSPRPKIDDPRVLNNKGFVIVTSEDVKSKLTKLDDYVAHKQSLGFTVYVITENDYGQGKGTVAAKNIRTWLHNNYQSKELLYALMLGDSNPLSGQVPMAALNTDIVDVQTRFDAGENIKVGIPADEYYADCSGSTWDLNGDNILGAGGDWDPVNGVDGHWDVLVGRIPYYGEDSNYGKAEDLDAILTKIISYETEDETAYRYSFDINDTTWNANAALYEWAGIEYMTRGTVGSGHMGTDFFSWQNHDFLGSYNVGFIRSGGHGLPWWQEGGLSTGTIRDHFNNANQFFSEIGSCDTGQIEYPENLAYMSLRYGSVGCEAPTRSVATLSTSKGTGPKDFEEGTRFQMLVNGTSQGFAHWHKFMSGQTGWSSSVKMWTLYGDPSIKLFPQGLKTTYPVVVRPAQKVQYNWDGGLNKPSQEYDITNNKDVVKTVSYSTDVDWLTLDKASESLAVGATSTLTVTVNSNADSLPEEVSTALIYIKDENGVTRTRQFNLRKRTPQLLADMTFENNTASGCPLLGSAGTEIACDQAGVVAGGVSGNGYDMSYATNGLTVSNSLIPTPGSADMTVSMWVNTATALTTDTTLVEGTTFSESGTELKLSLINSGTQLKLSWPSNHLSGAAEWKDSLVEECTGNVTLTPSTWHHVAFTMQQDNSFKLYWDGQEVGTFTHRNMTHNFTDLIFAKGFGGLIDEVQVTNYALTAADVTALYNQTLMLPANIGVSGVASHNNLPPVLNQNLLDLGDVRAEETTFLPIDLTSYVTDPEGGELLYSCSNTVAGAWVHGSGQFYINDGIARSVSPGAKVMTVSVSDDRGQSVNFDITFNLLPYLEYQTTVDAENGDVVYGHTPWSLNNRFQITGVVSTSGENGNNINKTAMTPVSYIDDFTADIDNVLEVYKGDTYDLSITMKDTGAPNGWVDGQVWIDWNRDGDWNDAGEALGHIGTTYGMGAQEKTFVKSVAVPLYAATGNTRMRIRVADSGSDLDSIMTSDSNIPVSYGTAQDYTINVAVDLDNTAPILNDVTFAVTENSAANTTVGSVSATDAEGDTLTYSIVAGSQAGNFAIDPTTGEIITTVALDYEAIQQYILTVEVSDGKLTSTAMVTVNVTDVVDLVDGDVIAVDLSSSGGNATNYNVIATSGGSVSAGQVVEYTTQQIKPELSVALSTVTGFNDDPAGGNWSGTAADAYYEVAADDISFSPNDISLTFSGLDDSFKFNVRVYNFLSGQDAVGQTITVTDGAATQQTSTDRGTIWNSATLEDAGLVFNGVSTDGSGNLVVTVSSSGGWSVLNAVVLEAVAPNYAPVAVGDSTTVDEDSLVVISVLDNDSDANGDSLTVSAVTQGVCGSVTTDGATVTYTPNPTCSGIDSFTYTITDGELTDTATVSVTINPINDAPVAADDSATVNEDGSVVVSVLSNDSDIDSSISVASVAQGTNGVVTTNGTTVTYTPIPNYNGVDTFTYTITDGELTDSATVSVTVNAVNDTPVATDDSATVDEDGSAVVAVLTNDSDIDSSISVTSVTQGVNGNVTTNGTTVTYIPVADFNGLDSFTYTITDGELTDTATVSVTVNAVNDTPVATDDSATVDEDGSVVITVLDNDSDVDSSISVEFVTQGSNGTVSTDGTTVTYLPDVEFFGDDSFSYTITDGEFSATATVSVTVNEVYEDLTVGDVIAVDLASAGGNAANYNVMDFGNGTIEAGSVVKYGNGSTVADNVSITLANVYNAGGDAAEATWSGTAADPYYVVEADDIVYNVPTNPITVKFSGLDDALTYNARVYAIFDDGNGATDTYTVTNGVDVETSVMARSDRIAKTTLEEAGGVFKYINTDGNGNITVGVQVTAGSGWTGFSAVVLEVVEPNYAPVATDDSTTVDEDDSVVVSVLGNDSDQDSDPLTVSIVTQGTNGAVTTDGTTVTYTPVADYNGIDSFTYTITDGEFSDTATVSVTVNAVNDAPVVTGESVTIDEDGAIVISVLTNDSDVEGDSLTVTAVTQGVCGSATTDGTSITYTGNADCSGLDSITYTVSDGELTDTASVSVTINPVNDAPVATDDSVTVDEDSSVVVSVLNNDSDIDSSISVASVTQGANGAVTTDGTTVTYTPVADFNGVDSFTYTITDGSLTDTAQFLLL